MGVKTYDNSAEMLKDLIFNITKEFRAMLCLTKEPIKLEHITEDAGYRITIKVEKIEQ